MSRPDYITPLITRENLLDSVGGKGRALAWTHLYTHATGLITGIGSIGAHGALVAREYGIPAVLGVGKGTERIAHGQRISVDGDAGVVSILPDD